MQLAAEMQSINKIGSQNKPEPPRNILEPPRNMPGVMMNPTSSLGANSESSHGSVMSTGLQGPSAAVKNVSGQIQVIRI